MWEELPGLIGSNEEEEMVCEPCGEEFVKPRVRKNVEEPTQEEVDEHNIDHGVFRAWCPHCVKAQAQSYGHMKRKDKEDRQVPVVGIDYMFMHEKQSKEEERGMPILAMRDSDLKITWAHVVPSKGRHKYAIGRLRKALDLLGHKKIVFNSDGENSIKALKEAVKLGSGWTS